MPRIVSVLLVALFCLSLIGPAAFASDAESRLPACCRHGGKHQCAMGDSGSPASSGPSLQAARCSCFPDSDGFGPRQNLSLPGIFPAIFAGWFSHPACHAQVEALCRISYSRAGQKRGPPSARS